MRAVFYIASLTRYAFRQNPLFYFSVFISLFSAAVELLAMSSIMPLFEVVSGVSPQQPGIVPRVILSLGIAVSAISLLWSFIILFAVRVVTQLIGLSLAAYLGKRVMAQLCSGAFNQIIHSLSIREVSTKSIGFYISLAGDEASRASTMIVSMSQFASVAALAALYFTAIFSYSPTAAGFVFVFLLVCMLAMIQVVIASHRLGEKQTLESRRAGTLFLDALNNLKAVRAFSAERYVVGIHRAAMFGYTKILFWLDEISLLTKLVPVLLLLLMFAGWMAIGGDNLATEKISFVVTLIVYLMRFFPVVGQGVTLLMRIASDARSGKDVTAILGHTSKALPASVAALKSIDRIELRDIGFSYDGPTGRMVLQDINARFDRGHSFAIVGRSGLGKSTLLDIVLKFIEPTKGELRFNDLLAAEIADAAIREHVILVGQDTAIFDDSVKNNICIGMDVGIDRVREATKLACIEEFINDLPQGFETRLQYQGSNLSGGQRQRIALARGLLRCPDVLILDEATSALDKSTQARVIENILREFRNSIVIFITHDPHIMGAVDTILDLEQLNAAAGNHVADSVSTQPD
jgi:ABC-type bacteriocin/lantibiotic exporter with double-glycine peptidase domain